jgi:hypothetical protein
VTLVWSDSIPRLRRETKRVSLSLVERMADLDRDASRPRLEREKIKAELVLAASRVGNWPAGRTRAQSRKGSLADRGNACGSSS